MEEEILAAELHVQTDRRATGIENAGQMEQVSRAAIDKELAAVNRKLERYTSEADKFLYAVSIFSGVLSGAIDAAFVGETVVTKDGDLKPAHEKVNHFIQKYAKFRGFPEDRLKDSIAELEKNFKVAQDNVWKGAEISVSAKNHHLADLAHHPTPVGLISAILVRFCGVGTFVNKEGEWHFLPTERNMEVLKEDLAAAAIAGILNWLVHLDIDAYEEKTGDKVSPTLKKIAHIAASSPMLIQIAKCADNWFGHLVSDMGGSKNTAGKGMGIPGVFVSFLQEVSSLPEIKDTGLPAVVEHLYNNQKIDMRHELAYLHAAKKQLIPVAFNEICTRVLYFVYMLGQEAAGQADAKGINWGRVVPFDNRTIDRMLLVSGMTFNMADTADAAVRAAVASGGDWIVFSAKFVARYNYAGVGRVALAIVKEVSDEKKEEQLLREKRMLTEAKTRDAVEQLQKYKAELAAKLSEYLEEDIESFITGFDYMQEGMQSGDSDLFIKGNVVIQRVLGREPQFTSQTEFDDLMDSDAPLIL